MAGQIASILCNTGDNLVYSKDTPEESRVTIRLSSLDFSLTEAKVFHVKQGRTKADKDLLASFSDISESTVEIKDVWLQNRDQIYVNSSNVSLVVNINEHRPTE